MPRTLSAPKNPEFFGQVVAALRLLAAERPAQSDVERSLLDTLAGQNLTRQAAAHMIGNLDAKSGAERGRFLGAVADPTFRLPDRMLPTAGQPPVRSSTTRTRDHRRGQGQRHGEAGPLGGTSSSGGVPVEDIVGERATSADPFPDVGPSIIYTLRYVGLFCQEDSNEAFSDETYVITSAIYHDGQGNNASTATINNPLNYPDGHYGDVDGGETLVGPVSVVWRGNTDTLSLIVIVMEHDQGDPDAWRDEVDKAVKAAIAVATYFWPPAAVIALVNEFIVDAINWLLDTDDDVISTHTEVLTRDQIEAYAVGSRTYQMGTKATLHWGSPPSVSVAPLTTPLFRHFATRHKGDGAEYFVGFDVLRDPPGPPPVIL